MTEAELAKRRVELQRAQRDADRPGMTDNERRNKAGLLARAKRRVADAEDLLARKQLARR